MPKYDSFEIWPVSQNPLSVVWEWAQFWAPGGKRVYMPLLEFFPMAKHANFMPKYGNFENQALSRKPLPIEQKYAQFRRPGIERECMWLLLELWPMAKLVVKQIERQGRWASCFVFVSMGPWYGRKSQAEHQGPWASCPLSLNVFSKRGFHYPLSQRGIVVCTTSVLVGSVVTLLTYIFFGT